MVFEEIGLRESLRLVLNELSGETVLVGSCYHSRGTTHGCVFEMTDYVYGVSEQSRVIHTSTFFSFSKIKEIA